MTIVAWKYFSVAFTLYVLNSWSGLFLSSTVLNSFVLLLLISIASSYFRPVSFGWVNSAVVFVITDWLSYYMLSFWDGDGWKSSLMSLLVLMNIVTGRWYAAWLYWVVWVRLYFHNNFAYAEKWLCTSYFFFLLGVSFWLLYV